MDTSKKTAIKRRGPSLPLRTLAKLKLIPSNVSVLDFGCGYGADVCYLGRRLGVSHGYDPNHEASSGKAFLLEGRYDIVLMTYVVNVLPDPGPALKEAWSHVKPGGRLFVTTRTEDEVDAQAERRGWSIDDRASSFGGFGETDE